MMVPQYTSPIVCPTPIATCFAILDTPKPRYYSHMLQRSRISLEIMANYNQIKTLRLVIPILKIAFQRFPNLALN